MLIGSIISDVFHSTVCDMIYRQRSDKIAVDQKQLDRSKFFLDTRKQIQNCREKTRCRSNKAPDESSEVSEWCKDKKDTIYEDDEDIEIGTVSDIDYLSSS